MDNQKCIVVLYGCRIYDFVNEAETDDEALMRTQKYYDMCFTNATEKAIHPDIFPDVNYWKATAENYKATLKKGFKIMHYDDFCVLQRQYLITGEPVEISEEEYEDAFDRFPPIFLGNYQRG